MKNCPLCGAEYAERLYILKILRALGFKIVKSGEGTITIQIPIGVD